MSRIVKAFPLRSDRCQYQSASRLVGKLRLQFAHCTDPKFFGIESRQTRVGVLFVWRDVLDKNFGQLGTVRSEDAISVTSILLAELKKQRAQRERN